MLRSSIILGLSTCAFALSIPYDDSVSKGIQPSVRAVSAACGSYWLEDMKHQGLASFNPNATSYKVFRNVKDYGARGDGVTDDSAAIQRAITDGNRCVPGYCDSSTITPAVVYFPGGTYIISTSIIDYYYTQIIGNPNCVPTIKASPNFSGSIGIIDGSPYQGFGPRTGKTGYGSTNTFYRQIRNLILDTTAVDANAEMTGIHWPTAQATSLQNIVFNMNANSGTRHRGIFIEEGSGGFMTDLTFNGGNRGFETGNQQFTTRNLVFNNVNTAIFQIFDWGWTYSGLRINNCRVGLNISNGGPDKVATASITLFDSEITNTPIGIITARDQNSKPTSSNGIYLENVKLNNVGEAVRGPSGTYLAGSSGSSVIAAWADGNRYLPNGPVAARGAVAATKRPASLLDASGNFYARSKPQYGSLPLSSILSARSLGCAGDGKTDDTKALNAAILKAKNENKVLFIDAGYYRVTGTIYVPPGSKIVGEALASFILSSGNFFNNMNSPQAVVKVGQQGEQGSVEISDLLLSTKGQQMGAILLEFNLANENGVPSGLWDVHTRVGGFTGSDLQISQCVKTPNTKITSSNLQRNCISTFMSMRVTKGSSGLYMENNWLWVADHDLDDASNAGTQITIYAGRGLLIESTQGRIWLYGTAVEHHARYEYQFVDTRNIFMGQVQTETAYYQPNPDATIPFPYEGSINDPYFTASSDPAINYMSGWGMRILRSNNILGYGVGLYSFFNNYVSEACIATPTGANCQARILSIEGAKKSYDINIYNLATVGVTQMITRDGKDIAKSIDNDAGFSESLNLYRIDGSGN